MPQIVREGERLDERLVEPQRGCQRSRHLHDLERVREARARVVALGEDDDLRLPFEPPERRAVGDSVAIALEAGAERVVGLGRCARANRGS